MCNIGVALASNLNEAENNDSLLGAFFWVGIQNLAWCGENDHVNFPKKSETNRRESLKSEGFENGTFWGK